MSHAPRKPPTLSQLLARLIKTCGIPGSLAAYAGSRWLTRTTRGRPRHTPAEFGWQYETLRCRTDDGHQLRGWLVAPSGPRGTVVLFHGAYRTRGQTLGRMTALLEAGFRCVAFDHRAHGESSGRRTSFGYFEREDVRAVLRLVRDRWPGEPCGALGISMGAAALCFAAEEASTCHAIILESPYHDIAGAFASRHAEYPPWLRRLSHGVIWITEWRLGLCLEQLAPAEHIGQLAPAPILLVTGANDSNAPPADAYRLQARCRGPAEVVTIPNADHLDLYETGGDVYRQCVLGFLDRCLGSTSHPREAA